METGKMLRCSALTVLALIACQLGADATPLKRPRSGFDHFDAKYTGGYSVSAPTDARSGPATIRIKVRAGGRSATIKWVNTIYTPHGSYRITMRWSFSPNGTVFASTIDPRLPQLAGTGTFTLSGNKPVLFTATSGTTTANGQLRLIGGGALAITVTLSGLPEGDATYTFSGGRKKN